MASLESRLVIKTKDETIEAFAEVGKRMSALERKGAAVAKLQGSIAQIEDLLGSLEPVARTKMARDAYEKVCAICCFDVLPDFIVGQLVRLTVTETVLRGQLAALESENRTLRAQLTVHRAAHKSDVDGVKASTAKPEDPRSAILAHGINADRLSDGYGR